MNRYESYLETGFEWIGKIPSSWELSRVGKFFTERSEKVDDVTYPPLSVTMNGIVDQLSDVAKSNDNDNRKLVKKDDFVINSRSDRKGSSGIAPRDGSVSLINIVLAPKNIDPKYIENLFKSYYFKEEYFRNGKGIHWDLWTTRWEQFKNINIPVPPHEEQKLISRYLDKKTSQIDSLVEKIQKKIELLNEQRTSLINHYVTKGLDPNVEMKDSGVEWIGEIPKHWDCKKLKYISNITYGISPNESTYNDDGRGTVLINGPVEYSTTDFGYTRSIKWTTDPKNMVPKGSLLFCVRGSTTGRMNICHQDVSIGRGVCSIESKLDQDFTVFSMMMIRIYIQDQISGSTFPSVVKEDVDNFVLPCPPIEEQRSISKFLTTKIDVIDNLIDRHYQKKDHLIEYRRSLISSVVTGKVRVTEDML